MGRGNIRKIVFLCLMLSVMLVSFSYCNQDTSRVFIVPVKGPVEPGLTAFIKRALSIAEEQKATCVIFDIDTLGGRVDSAVNIRDLIVESSISQKIAFIDKKAISAGALIAISSQKIYAKSMATIGAAKPVLMGGPTSEMKPADEKVVSYLRSEFKATAEKNGHPVDIVEAFVDQDLSIDGLIEKGKLLTLTATEAVNYGLVVDKVDNLDSLLVKLGLGGERYENIDPNWSEIMVRFLTHPSVSGILMIVGMLGVFTEIKTPGFGLPGIIGGACLTLFFFAQHLVGLADHVEILLFLTGIVLLVLEIFVIPGFGLCGILGIGFVIGALFLSLVGSTVPDIPVNPGQIGQAFHTMVFVLAGIILGGFLVFKYVFPVLVRRSPLVLNTHLDSGLSDGLSSGPSLSIGDTGKALTSLHPTGKAMFGDDMLDVFSDGEFIEEGDGVEVVEIAGNRVKVCKKD